MKKITIVLILPLFVLLAGCGTINVSNDEIKDVNILESGSSVNMEEVEVSIDLVETGIIEEIEIIEENTDLIEEDVIGTGELDEKFDEIKDLFDDYSDQITGDSVDDNDIEIMYKIIDILTSKKE